MNSPEQANCRRFLCTG